LTFVCTSQTSSRFERPCTRLQETLHHDFINQTFVANSLLATPP